MNNIILVGHGNFATGLESAVKLILGNSEKLVAIDFIASMSREELKSKVESKLGDEQNIILTDVLGGTPFNVSAELVNENTKVIYGTNLGILLEIVSSDSFELDEEILISTVGSFSVAEVV